MTEITLQEKIMTGNRSQGNNQVLWICFHNQSVEKDLLPFMDMISLNLHCILWIVIVSILKKSNKKPACLQDPKITQKVS